MMTGNDEYTGEFKTMAECIAEIDRQQEAEPQPATDGAGALKGPRGIGFTTFTKLKSFLGPAGENRHWHHIVEKCQIDKSGFSAEQIHNTDNIISIDKETHAKISGFYSSKPRFRIGKTVRDWLSGQSYEVQYSARPKSE